MRSSSTPWAGPFQEGEIVAGSYQVTDLLGSGGMAVVYEALDLELGRRVALKVPRCVSDEVALRKEARALAAVHHPNLVTVHALAHHGGLEVLVMERLAGVTLEARLDAMTGRGESMRLEEVLDRLVAIADALAAVHRGGIAHRDVKTGNVMVCGERTVLTDFGLVTPEFDVRDESFVCGSAEYMAPELIGGSVRRGSGPLVDLYALGAVAFELLTGAPPYTGDDVTDVFRRHIAAEVPDVRASRPDTPPALAELIASLLAKSPDDRPETAEVVLWRLGAMSDRSRLWPRRVVIVDDEPGTAALLGQCLRASLPHLEVLALSSPVQALASLQARPPDVAIIDLHMPEINGVELCMHLLATPAATRPMIVAVSADAADGDVDLLRSLGVSAFIAKDGGFLGKVCNVLGELRFERAGTSSPRSPSHPGPRRSRPPFAAAS